MWEIEKKVIARTAGGNAATQAKKSFDSHKQNGIEQVGDPVTIKSLNTGEVILEKPIAKRISTWELWTLDTNEIFFW